MPENMTVIDWLKHDAIKLSDTDSVLQGIRDKLRKGKAVILSQKR